MKGQTKLSKLTEQYPALGLICYDWRWKKAPQGKLEFPTMNVRIQRADTTAMHLQASNTDRSMRSYIGSSKHDDDRRGVREQYFCAVDNDGEIIAKLFWLPEEELTQFSKDIFPELGLDPEKVDHFMWVSGIEWYEPPSEEEKAKDICFGKTRLAVEVDVIIYLKPKDMSFLELITLADKEKKEREEAYLHPPKETPELTGVHQALRAGCTMRGFRSGGGLRVLRLEANDVLKGYGEHPNADQALVYLDEDYLAGKRFYDDVYGKMYPHYLTGTSLATSNIDGWILQGNTFLAWQENDEFVFQLKGTGQTTTPDWVNKFVRRYEAPILWHTRGYTFSSKLCDFVGDDTGMFTSVVQCNGNLKECGSRAWMYPITKTGRGKNIWEAMQNAFAAREVASKED